VSLVYPQCDLTQRSGQLLAGVRTTSQHVYDIRPRSGKRAVDLISDARPFGRLCYAEPNAITNAIGYAIFYIRSQDAVIRVYDETGNVIETHEHWRVQGAVARLSSFFASVAPPFGSVFGFRSRTFSLF
jgi:hypothetical protein